MLVSPVSLGYDCNIDMECRARDPYSRCVNRTCECIVPDDTCSAKNRGKIISLEKYRKFGYS